MMNMKKAILLMQAGVMALSLMACAASNDSATAGSPL